MTGKNSLLLFFFVLILCSSASASLLVHIAPKDPNFETLSLYPYESGEYTITVLNNGPETVENVMLKISAADGLKIIDSGFEKSAVSRTINSLDSGAKESLLLKLKPIELSSKNLSLYIDYGVGKYTHLSATFVEIKESPLHIDASLSKTALDMGEEASISLSLKNNGAEEIKNINAELIVFQGLESKNGTVSLDALAAGEGFEAKEFKFRADPSATGERAMVLQVSFEDSFGKHVIEKGFSVEIQSKQTILYLMVGVIVLLIAVAFLSRRGESKNVDKLEKPVANQIEKTNSKQGP